MADGTTGKMFFFATIFHVITLIVNNTYLEVTGSLESKFFVGINLLISFDSPKESKKLIGCKLKQKYKVHKFIAKLHKKTLISCTK